MSHDAVAYRFADLADAVAADGAGLTAAVLYRAAANNADAVVRDLRWSKATRNAFAGLRSRCAAAAERLETAACPA